MGIPIRTEERPDATPPELDELTAALKLVLRKGLPVTPDTGPNLLVQLRSVQARSINPSDYLSRVKALNAFLGSLLLGLGDSEEAQALQILFAARAENRGTTLTERRRRAASVGIWDYDLTHFRKHIEPRLVRDLAWSLHDDNQTYTPRTKHAPAPTEISGDTPSLSPADVNEQEELVSRIWALVYELRADLIRKAILETQTPPDATAIEAAEGTCLWTVAHLLTRIHDYLDHYGERILHGDAEFRAEGLIRLAGWSYELTPEEATRLRFLLAKVGETNRDRFLREAKKARVECGDLDRATGAGADEVAASAVREVEGRAAIAEAPGAADNRY